MNSVAFLSKNSARYAPSCPVIPVIKAVFVNSLSVSVESGVAIKLYYRDRVVRVGQNHLLTRPGNSSSRFPAPTIIERITMGSSAESRKAESCYGIDWLHRPKGVAKTG